MNAFTAPYGESGARRVVSLCGSSSAAAKISLEEAKKALRPGRRAERLEQRDDRIRLRAGQTDRVVPPRRHEGRGGKVVELVEFEFGERPLGVVDELDPVADPVERGIVGGGAQDGSEDFVTVGEKLLREVRSRPGRRCR